MADVISQQGEITRLLEDVRLGRSDAADRLTRLVYDQLRGVARRHLGRERAGHTLQPTALVNEALMELLGNQSVQPVNRAHFFRLASLAMRRILVNYARMRNAEKRGGEFRKVTWDDLLDPGWRQPETVIAVHKALESLAIYDSRLSQVVEMRFFGGMTEEEIGLVLDLSVRQVKRDWAFAKKWLKSDLS